MLQGGGFTTKQNITNRLPENGAPPNSMEVETVTYWYNIVFDP